MSLVQKATKAISLYTNSIRYNLFSQDLHAMLICDGLGKLLTAKHGGRVQAALVSENPQLLRMSEVLHDSGFDIQFYGGNPDDVYHPSKPVSAITEKVILDGPGIPLSRLIQAHTEALNRMDRTVSCLNPRKLSLIAAAIATTDPARPIVECGVYLGGTTIYMALLQEALGITRKIYALDTFEGMPAPTDKDLGGGFVYEAGTFTETRLDLVKRSYNSAKVGHLIEPVKGLCQDTIPNIAKNGVSFALLDMDQYAGTKGALDCIKLGKDDLIIVDDSTVHGVNNAINESSYTRRSLVHNFDLLTVS